MKLQNFLLHYLLFAATWLVRRPIGVRMRDILNSESDNQPETSVLQFYVKLKNFLLQ